MEVSLLNLTIITIPQIAIAIPISIFGGLASGTAGNILALLGFKFV